MNDKESSNISLPMAISLIKKLGGNGGGGVGGDYLPLSGGTMSGDLIFENGNAIKIKDYGSSTYRTIVTMSDDNRLKFGDGDGDVTILTSNMKVNISDGVDTTTLATRSDLPLPTYHFQSKITTLNITNILSDIITFEHFVITFSLNNVDINEFRFDYHYTDNNGNIVMGTLGADSVNKNVEFQMIVPSTKDKILIKAVTTTEDTTLSNFVGTLHVIPFNVET